MAEIKCPKCKEVFQVDDSDYAQIVTQIRDKEFDAELRHREEAIIAKKESDIEIARLKEEKKQEEIIVSKNSEIANMEKEIAELKAKLNSADADKKLAVMEAITIKDKELDDMLRQLYIYSAAIKQEFGKYFFLTCLMMKLIGLLYIFHPFNSFLM